MFYTSFMMWLFVGNILHSSVANFQVLIFRKFLPTRTNYFLPTEQPIETAEDFIGNLELDRLDIEDYEEPTELPDIDNLDYTKDRVSSNSYEDVNLIREDFINITKNQSKSFKSNTKSKDTIQRREENGPTFEQDSLVGQYKIVGGEPADINLYPYHVAYGTNCAGAILSENWIITAGHCGWKPNVRVGSTYRNQGEIIGVNNVYIHPNWSSSPKDHPFDYDFGLVELDEPLDFNEGVQPVKVARAEDMAVGKEVTVTGWGHTKENGFYSSVLRSVKVPIISKEDCQLVPFPFYQGQLTEHMFCAGYPEGLKDACQGDSGGPAVAEERLLGLVSFGYGCATPGAYGVYSKVASVRSWIEDITGLELD